jgi:serine/threonine-protein kinase
MLKESLMAHTPTPAGGDGPSSRRERIARMEQIGRYVLYPEIARGGMATVHTARLVASEGVSRLVAAKRLHPQFSDEPDFVAMFGDEARIASQIHHPNVVPVLDIVRDGEEVILVQEYVHGVPLSQLFRRAMTGEPIPIGIVAAILGGVLAGLHGAHEATDELGETLGIVHRDVSPQNVLISVDGIPRVVDFGIAKAKSNVHQTREGIFKGKLAYMAPEQIRSQPVTRQADVYSAGAMLWELVVNRRFYDGKNDAEFVRSVAMGRIPRLTQVLESERAAMKPARWEAIVRLEPIVARALSISLTQRYGTAQAMAADLSAAVKPASASEVAAWITSAGAEFLAKRQEQLAENEASYRAHARAIHVLHRDDDVQGSGARLRSLQALETGTVTVSEVPSGVRSEVVPRRTIVPWLLVGALLVIVGVLSGIVVARLITPAEIGARLPDTADAKPSLSASASPSTVALEPTDSAASSPSAAALPPPRPAPVRAPPPVRYIPPPPPLRVVPPPVASPSPLPAPPKVDKADCSPPFYFEGTKKVFKPNCL